MKRLPILAFMLLPLAGCGGPPSDALSEEDLQVADPDWPDSLPPKGDGYPDVGDPCREVGKSKASEPFFEDNAKLVGCRDPRDAAMLDDARVVGEVDGITLVSVTLPPPPPEPEDDPSALEPAARLIPCTGRGIEGAARCTVTVEQDEGGATRLDIRFDNGNRRSLYFEGRRLTGADSSPLDGSDQFVLDVRRDFDRTIVSYGPERFVIPDALLPRPPRSLGQADEPDDPLAPIDGN